MFIRFFKHPLWFVAIFFVIIFSPIFSGKIPVPFDSMVGLYHPWRDFYSNQYPSGIPYKNFLVTDPVRQQYIWRYLSIESLKSGKFPGWNPYSLSGAPLSGNFQSAAFYPLNIFYFVTSFENAWVLQVLLQSILGSIFMYAYLRNRDLHSISAVFGAIVWMGSGFVVSWWTLNTLVATAIYLPLILLSVDKITTSSKTRSWIILLSLSLVSSFLAGAMQVFLYEVVFVGFYVLAQFKLSKLKSLLIAGVIFLILTSGYALHIFQFSSQALRTINYQSWKESGWFLPWQNLIQFIAPDFFGNPATLNYFGVWNYMEFVGYIGILPLFFAIIGIIKHHVKNRIFIYALLASFLLILPSFISQIPYVLQIPIFSIAQPTRLMFLICFSLATMSSFGFDWFLSHTEKIKVTVILGIVFIVVGLLCYIFAKYLNLEISVRNLYLPLILIFSCLPLLMALRLNRKVGILLILAITIFDLSRFTLKFEPYSSREWTFPLTKTLSFLQTKSTADQFRISTMNDQVLPPNFSDYYHLQSVGGYDSLILGRYGQLISSIQRGAVNKSTDLDFNRVVIPNNYNSPLFGLLNVRYILSLEDIKSDKLKLVFTEGKTKVYENSNMLPRVYFAKHVYRARKDDVLNLMFDRSFSASDSAVVEDFPLEFIQTLDVNKPTARIISYSPSEIIIEAQTSQQEFLVLLDSYYPAWKLQIDGVDEPVYPTNYAFRGIQVPKGNHRLVFYYSII